MASRRGRAHARGRHLPLERVFDINRRVHDALGADLDALDVRLDTTPRDGRPAVPVAFTTFGARPRGGPTGAWSPGEPTVLASYVDGGLGELTELIHETGHAIHIAAIHTRPAFTDWPDSDALTEALAELVSLDTAEPAWQRRWIDGAPAIPEATAIRCRYAEVALDAAWALLEIRLIADPTRTPNDVWSDITSTYLGIAPHPEWSWWAMRGQLVQEPGYMANYAIGAVLAADLRAAIRAARGDWTGDDPGWYAWVTEHCTGSGSSAGPGTSCATSWDVSRPRPRSAARSPAPGPDEPRSAHPLGRPPAAPQDQDVREDRDQQARRRGRQAGRCRSTAARRAATRVPSPCAGRRPRAGTGQGRRSRAATPSTSCPRSTARVGHVEQPAALREHAVGRRRRVLDRGRRGHLDRVGEARRALPSLVDQHDRPARRLFSVR